MVLAVDMSREAAAIATRRASRSATMTTLSGDTSADNFALIFATSLFHSCASTTCPPRLVVTLARVVVHRAVRIVSRYPVLGLELRLTADNLVDDLKFEPSCGRCHWHALECADFGSVLAIEPCPAKLAESRVACHAESLASPRGDPPVTVYAVYLLSVPAAKCCRQAVGWTA